MNKIIGKCSICGGQVTESDSSNAVSQKPSCCKCGATKKDDLPTIEMMKEHTQDLLLG